MLDHRLLLYISPRPLPQGWCELATRFHWHVLHEHDLYSALGAYITLMPSLIVIDGRDEVGRATLMHLHSVLDGAPQDPLLLVELDTRHSNMPTDIVPFLQLAYDTTASDLLQYLCVSPSTLPISRRRLRSR